MYYLINRSQPYHQYQRRDASKKDYCRTRHREHGPSCRGTGYAIVFREQPDHQSKAYGLPKIHKLQHFSIKLSQIHQQWQPNRQFHRRRHYDRAVCGDCWHRQCHSSRTTTQDRHQGRCILRHRWAHGSRTAQLRPNPIFRLPAVDEESERDRHGSVQSRPPSQR